MEQPMIYAVDFDGTLCKVDKYPNIGDKNQCVIDFVKNRKAEGCKIILWTMREGEALKNALDWCHDNGLKFDAVNDNLPELKKFYHNNPRKVFANYYIDDRNITLDQIRSDNL